MYNLRYDKVFTNDPDCLITKTSRIQFLYKLESNIILFASTFTIGENNIGTPKSCLFGYYRNI